MAEAAEARGELTSPFRRELFTASYDPRWVRVDTDTGPVRAVTFVVNLRHPFYAGRLEPETAATTPPKRSPRKDAPNED